MRMTIGKKLGWGFGVVLILTISAGGYGIVSYLKMAHTYAEYVPIQLGQFDLVGDTSLNFKKQVQEWKDILLRGHNPEDFKKYTEQFYKQQEEVRKDIADLKSGPYKLTSEKNKKLLEEFIKKYDVLNGEYAAALKLCTAYTGGNFKEADAYVRGKDRGATDFMDGIIEGAKKHTQQKLDQMKAQSISGGIIIGIVLFFATILSMIIGVRISQGITNPIIKLKNAAAEIGKGKLGASVVIKSKDEIGELATSFNKMSLDLQNNQEEIQVQNEELNTSNEELKSSNEELATNNEELRTTTEELRQTNEELAKFKAEFEQKLEERTQEAVRAKKELEKKVADLERFNKLAVGRELAMKELKARIAELEAKLSGS